MGTLGGGGRRARWLARRLVGPGAGRPAPLAAARVALALAAPLAMGLLIGRRDLAILATGAALFTAVVEPGGGYGRHLRVYGAMTILNAVVTMAALLVAGHAVAAGLVMLALGIAAGVATAWGAVPTSMAPAALILFILAEAFTPSPAFWAAVLAVVAGTAWVALISVLPWPVAPYAPAELAVANAWLAVAHLAARPDDDRRREAAIRSIEAARDTVGSVRSRRPGWSRESARLWATVIAAQRVSSLISATEDERRRESALPAVRTAMDDVLSEVATASREVAAAVIDMHRPVDLTDLSAAVARLHALLPDPSTLEGAARHEALVAAGRARSAGRLERRVRDAARALSLPDPPRVRIARPDRRTSHVTLRAALDPRGAGVRHGLRLGIATGVSVGAFTALSGTPVLGITHGQWVSIALVGVLQPTLGDSVQVAAQRAIGTVIGALIAMALLATLTGDPWALAAGIVVIGAVAALLEPVNYAWFIVLFTPLSLMLSAFGAGLDAAIATERLIATGIACGIGVLLATVAWPTRSGEELPGVLARALRAAADDLGAVLGVAGGAVARSRMTEVHQRAVVATDDAARVTQARMAESIEAFTRPDALAALEATSMQLVRDIGALGGRIPLDGVEIPGADAAGAAMTDALTQVANALGTGSPAPSLDGLPDCLDPARDAVQRMEAGGTTVRGLASSVDMLETIANTIQRLADEANRWETARMSPHRGWWRRLVPAPAAG